MAAISHFVIEANPSWPKQFTAAWNDIGTHEIRGGETTRIIEYHKFTSLRASEDEIPWCSAAMCAWHEEQGITSTFSAMARSWLDWGTSVQLSDAIAGDVVILWRVSRASRSGHVGFYVGRNRNTVFLLGGNQSDSVKISSYPISKVLGVRRNVSAHS